MRAVLFSTGPKEFQRALGHELSDSVATTAEIIFFLMDTMTIVEVIDVHLSLFSCHSTTSSLEIDSSITKINLTEQYLGARPQPFGVTGLQYTRFVWGKRFLPDVA